MNSEIVLIMPSCQDEAKADRLRDVLDHALLGVSVKEMAQTASQLRQYKGERVLFAIPLGLSGVNLEFYGMLRRIRKETEMFSNCTGAIIVDGESELFTKSVARNLAFALNRAGCALIGKPLVEGTGSLDNFHILAQVQDTDIYGAYLSASRDLLVRLLAHEHETKAHRELLVVHASSHETSNTFALWSMVKQHLGPNITLQEIGLRNGAVLDCSGCPFKMCRHFGERGECFYGGVISEDVYPALERCDGLVMLCPNYNDALSANLTAFVNRLTAIYRKRSFFEQSLFAIIVSGYSGGDILAEQLIAGINMNKSFYLPPRFCMLETANNAGSIYQVTGIEERARDFARRIMED